MRVLVTFAVEAEFAPWRRLRKFVERDDGDCTIYATQFREAEINVLLTGIGGKSAWLETTKRVWNGDVEICVSSGLAGALRQDYQVGEILAARAVRAASWGKTVACDAGLMRLAVENGGREVGTFYSADHVVVSADEKRELGKSFEAVEMESGDVLYEAAAFGARVIAIRGISDAAEEDLPLNFNRVLNSSGEVSIPRVLGEVAKHPTSVPALIRFGQQSRMAAERLCEFLENYFQKLSSAQRGLPREVAAK
jgi:adenosylhomocysteine nucleosidase